MYVHVCVYVYVYTLVYTYVYIYYMYMYVHEQGLADLKSLNNYKDGLVKSVLLPFVRAVGSEGFLFRQYVYGAFVGRLPPSAAGASSRQLSSGTTWR